MNPFRYRGYYYDTETGLYYLKSRYYDPEVGRFITIDDISYIDPESINGLNLYSYCGNNPVMRVDTNGNAWWDWLFGGLIVFGLIAGAVALTVFTGGTAFAALSPLVAVGAKLATAFVTGAAVAATISYGTQIEQKSFSWQQFGLDIAAGAVSGLVSYGIGTALNYFGGIAGQILSKITIHGKTLSRIVSLDIFMSVGSKLFEIIGGCIFGLFFDNILNQLLNGQKQSVMDRIKGYMDSSFIGKIFNFFAYLWR